MAAQLTTGAVAALTEHVDGNGTLQPVLQVMDVRPVPSKQNPSSERFRMVLSDGVHTLQSMLATAENPRVHDGTIKKGTVIHLQEFTCSTIQNRRYGPLPPASLLLFQDLFRGGALASPTKIESWPARPRAIRSAITIVIKLDILQSDCDIIGNPRPYEMTNPPREQSPNLQASAAQANTGPHSTGPGMLGSSTAPRAAQVANNVSHGGSYGGYPGMGAPPTGRTAEPVPNVSSGGSYGRTSAHNTMNTDTVQSNLQQPSLNSNQNQRFAVPAMAGGGGTPGNTYGRPAQSFYQQPPPGNMNRGPAAKNEVTRLIPVAQLNPYQERWTIKARVTSKSDMRSYNNKKGSGKLFSFEVIDAQGGEIRVTCFNTQADMFFGLIEIDKVYLISRGTVKPAQKMYNPLNHDYEISLDFRSTVDLCPDDGSVNPRLRYNFRPISEIENIEVGAIVDLVGIVTSVAPSATITRKDGSEAQKRTLQLKDMSGRSVEVTFWGKFCDAEGQQLQSLCDSGLNPVLALRNVRVTEFNGRNVNSIATTQLKVNPDFPEAESLRQWYVTEGKTAACVPLSVASMGRTDVRKTIAQIKDENLGRSEKPDWVTVKGAVSHLPTDGTFCYPACTLEVNGRQCNKKVTNNGDGTWHCDKCDRSMPNCEYRYMMQCQFQDHTGTAYATAFQEAGLEIMVYSAQELFEIREEDAERYAEILQGIRWQQFLFKLKVKEETYNDEQRVKNVIVKAEKLDPSRESSYLLGVINNSLSQVDTDSPPEVQAPMAYSGGFHNVGAGQGAPTSNSAYTTNMSGPRYGESANQLAQAANMHGGTSTPLSVTRPVQQNYMPSSGYNVQNYSAGVHRQQPAASAASSFGSSQPDNAGSGLCSRCHQPGHAASACPMLGSTAPLREPYVSEATSGGYSRQQQQPQPQQHYVGATSYNY
ncbi:hypothetical protein U9M48_041545 [Paspalum notatum var. saurae]|uniref:Replication protein A subunit n=1 Tax=Paspalum notatum var. saurae TaxID=547442 RepID=A0AAQ3XFD4_PASNO